MSADRALAQLGAHLRKNPAYDWAARLTESPPRRPVQHIFRTEQRHGIPGLDDDELLDVAELVVTGATTRRGTHQRVLDAVLERCLVLRLAERLGDRLVDEALTGATLSLTPCGHDDLWGVHASSPTWGHPSGAWPADTGSPEDLCDGPWDAG